MEQEERDAYKVRYGEEALRRRDIHARFAVFASERLEGPQSEEWGKFLEMVMQLEEPYEVLFGVLRRFIPKCLSRPIWRTVHLVPEADPRMTFVTAIGMAGMKVGNWAQELLRQPAFTVVTEETEVKLVRVTVAELGFENRTTREQIYARAEELGLGLCPAEVGPQLRLQYPDQPMHEQLFVGMEPITASDGSLCIFSMEHLIDGRFLHCITGNADFLWAGGDQWLFVSRK